MKVFKSQRENLYHLVYAHSWENFAPEQTRFVTMRVQFFCQDQGWPYSKNIKFTIEPYSKEKHRKILYLACVKKASKSKRYEPKIEGTA